MDWHIQNSHTSAVDPLEAPEFTPVDFIKEETFD